MWCVESRQCEAFQTCFRRTLSNSRVPHCNHQQETGAPPNRGAAWRSRPAALHQSRFQTESTINEHASIQALFQQETGAQTIAHTSCPKTAYVQHASSKSHTHFAAVCQPENLQSEMPCYEHEFRRRRAKSSKLKAPHHVRQSQFQLCHGWILPTECHYWSLRTSLSCAPCTTAGTAVSRTRARDRHSACFFACFALF